MRIKTGIIVLTTVAILCSTSCTPSTSNDSTAPHLSENAQILLGYFYEISGEKTLTGRYNNIGKLTIYTPVRSLLKK